MSQFANKIFRKLNKLWLKVVGLPTEFSMEVRSFHAISAFSFTILLLLLPFNVGLGLISSSIIIVILLILQIFFYYLSRFKLIHIPGIIVYILATYATLVASFFLDNGSQGPALPLFFLTFMLLIVLSPVKYHWIVVLTHITVAQSLLLTEQLFPDSVRQTYKSTDMRYIDLTSTYVITVCFIYFMIRYLDLRSPIDSIQSYLELINREALHEEEKEMFKQSLLDLTQHTSDMLSNMLLWANSQMNGASVKVRAINLNDSLRNILNVEQSIAAKKGITLDYTISDDIQVIADPDMLGVVFRNLVNNAIKFTHSGGKISVAAKQSDGICTLTVSDTGIGIKPEKIEHLFSVKTETSFGTQNEKGIGLGLVLCKEYIELQGGTIRAESSDAGTTFYVTLPLPK
jgi:two-component system sensor histidine kinase/response regulator